MYGSTQAGFGSGAVGRSAVGLSAGGKTLSRATRISRGSWCGWHLVAGTFSQYDEGRLKPPP